jgi:chitin disaccharide deacetylase
MKRLIINADDLGADEGRNEGIFEAIRAGVVTSASLLPNGPALGRALEGIRAGRFEKVSFGVHLNLTEGRPLAEGLSCLAGPDGNFRGKAAAHRLLMTEGDASLRSDIACEAALQIERLLGAAVGITHVDGHQHVHVFPAVLRTVAQAAQSRGIRRMRIPDEAVPPVDETVPAELLEEARYFGALGKAARGLLDGSGILAPAHFRGLLLKGRLSAETLVAAIEQLPDGLTELMVHPGRVAAGHAGGPFAGFSTVDREREIEALLDPSVRRTLKRSGVLLTSYREVDR